MSKPEIHERRWFKRAVVIIGVPYLVYWAVLTAWLVIAASISPRGPVPLWVSRSMIFLVGSMVLGSIVSLLVYSVRWIKSAWKWANQ